MTCSFTDTETIKVEDIVVDDTIANTHITITLTNFEIFVTTPTVTDSWELMVYTKEGHFVEERFQSFSLEFLCSLPCQTCKTGEPSTCTSCNTLTGKEILYMDVCYETCPETTFYNASNYGCQKCNSNCLNCNYHNGNECTSCDPTGLLPYLDGTVCKAECPFGLYEDATTHKCELC